MKATIWNAGQGREISLRNEIGIEFNEVIPIVTLKGFKFCGGGASYWWFEKDNIKVLVARAIGNKMVHGFEPTGILDSFVDKKDSTKLVYKFISLLDIQLSQMPKSK
jgi:hypothetical protein